MDTQATPIDDVVVWLAETYDVEDISVADDEMGHVVSIHARIRLDNHVAPGAAATFR